jgi:hypothetical protein
MKKTASDAQRAPIQIAVDADSVARRRWAIDRYLLDIHASMWGRFFDIETPEKRVRATDFILEVMNDVLTIEQTLEQKVEKVV